jgi:hypothetical protein
MPGCMVFFPGTDFDRALLLAMRMFGVVDRIPGHFSMKENKIPILFQMMKGCFIILNMICYFIVINMFMLFVLQEV